jgi:hypothetical protein
MALFGRGQQRRDRRPREPGPLGHARPSPEHMLAFENVPLSTQ